MADDMQQIGLELYGKFDLMRNMSDMNARISAMVGDETLDKFKEYVVVSMSWAKGEQGRFGYAAAMDAGGG